MLAEMTARELSEWEIFNKLEPFPEDKIIDTLAIGFYRIASAFIKVKGGRKWKVSDFKPEYKLAKKEQEIMSPDNMLSALVGAKQGRKARRMKAVLSHKARTPEARRALLDELGEKTKHRKPRRLRRGK